MVTSMKKYTCSLPLVCLSQPDLVCKRSLYGLKQANKQWNIKLTLNYPRYIQSKVGYSFFTKKRTLGFTVILVYVDYLVLGGKDANEIQNIKTLLNGKFNIKNLGTLKYFQVLKLLEHKMESHGVKENIH